MMDELMDQQTALDAEIIAEIKQLVGEDRLEDALQKLARLENCQNDALKLTQQLTYNSREGRLGTITSQDARVERTRIAAAVIECLKPNEQISAASDLLKKSGWADDFAQWVMRRRRSLGRGAVFIGLIWLILAMSRGWPPFQPRLVWIPQSQTMTDTWNMFGVGNTLLVGGKNLRDDCAHSEKGLWRSDDHGRTWQSLNAPVEFPDVNDCDYLAAIVGFAASPARPQYIYVATDKVGLLRYDTTCNAMTSHNTACEEWQRFEWLGPELSKLKAVAVDEQADEVILVAAQGAGLYRIDEENETKYRLDGRRDAVPDCTIGVPFTKTLSVGVLYSTASAIIVGTDDPEQLTPDHVPVGLYMSTDGGDCWQLLHAGGDEYEYVQVADTLTATRQFLFFVSKDWRKQWPQDSLELWQMDLTPQQTPPRLLWKHSHGVEGLIVRGHDDQLRWYIATMYGLVFQGSLDSTQTVRLPWVTRCIVPCELAFALDPDMPGPLVPLLLAANRVYRLEEFGPWWRRIWP